MDIKSILQQIAKYMKIDTEKTYIVDLIIATAISLALPRPVWMMVTAPPSSGKTELLRIISRIDKFHEITNISPRFLFSGHPDAGGGYMIREVGKEGILAFPDFTTILSINANHRAEILNQLRVIYDGKAGRGTGIDMGRIPEWKGKVALIACVTQAIEIMKIAGNDLGERCIYYNYFPAFPIEPIPFRTEEQEKIRNEMPGFMKKYINERQSEVINVKLSTDQQEFIFNLAIFVARARAAVSRDSSIREIVHVYEPEQPYRLLEVFSTLFRCLLSMEPEDESRNQNILREVAWSSIPYQRFKILEKLVEVGKPVEHSTFTEILRISHSALYRQLEDMMALRLIEQYTQDRMMFRRVRIHPSFEKTVRAVF